MIFLSICEFDQRDVVSYLKTRVLNNLIKTQQYKTNCDYK